MNATSLLAALAAAAGIVSTACAQDAPPLDRVKLPPGFSIEVFATGVKDARSMALGDKGTLFVGTRTDGRVYAIRNDGRKATEVITIATGPQHAQRRGGAGTARSSWPRWTRSWRYDAIESKLATPPEPKLVYDKYPTDRHHGWKFIRFGPDGWLYVPVGAPCNICDREATRMHRSRA